MSSLRNAVPARSYRERAQPLNRERRHGLLEKHKDYSLRAKDHNEKKRRLKVLREKAATRNDDEFFFEMLNSKSKNGVKIADRGNKAMRQEVVQLLKTQDAGYLRTMLQMTRKERARLEQAIYFEERKDDDGEVKKRLVGLKGDHAATHTVFVNDQDELLDFDAAEHFDTDDVDSAFNRPYQQSPVKMAHSAIGNKPAPSDPKLAKWKAQRVEQKKRALQQQKLQARLALIKERQTILESTEQELEKQRAQMANTTGGVNKNGVKFTVRERKR